MSKSIRSHSHPGDDATTLPRRELLVALAVAAGGVLVHRPSFAFARASGAAVRALRVRLVLVAGDDEPAQSRMLGALMGVDEAQRAATLFGGTVEQTTVRLTAPEEAESAMGAAAPTAIVGGAGEIGRGVADWAAANGIPYLDTDGVEDAGGAPRSTFHLLPSHAARQAALRAWLAGPGAAGGWTLDADGMRATRADGAHAAVTAWDATLERFGGDQLNQRFARWAHREMDECAWSGWLAAKAAWEAALRARSDAPAAVASLLASGRGQLDGHKGVQLTFDAGTHELRQPLYVVARDASGARLAVSDVPRSARPGKDTTAER